MLPLCYAAPHLPRYFSPIVWTMIPDNCYDLLFNPTLSSYASINAFKNFDLSLPLFFCLLMPANIWCKKLEAWEWEKVCVREREREPGIITGNLSLSCFLSLTQHPDLRTPFLPCWEEEKKIQFSSGLGVGVIIQQKPKKTLPKNFALFSTIAMFFWKYGSRTEAFKISVSQLNHEGCFASTVVSTLEAKSTSKVKSEIRKQARCCSSRLMASNYAKFFATASSLCFGLLLNLAFF